jgi:hypothetical protein
MFMSQCADIAERRARILGDLAERGHALACKLHDDAMAADEPEARTKLAAAFHQVARTVRQTLALEVRIERDLARAEREARLDLQAGRERAVTVRKARVKAAVESLAWTEAEPDEAHRILDALDVLLADDSADPAFLDGEIDSYIARLRHDLGLDPDDEAKPPPRGRFRRYARGEPRWMWEPYVSDPEAWADLDEDEDDEDFDDDDEDPPDPPGSG